MGHLALPIHQGLNLLPTVFRLKSSLEEVLATNREQASDIANLQDELRKIHSSYQVRKFLV